MSNTFTMYIAILFKRNWIERFQNLEYCYTIYIYRCLEELYNSVVKLYKTVIPITYLLIIIDWNQIQTVLKMGIGLSHYG